MTITLYDATVKNYLRTLDAIKAVLEKGLEHCKQNDINPDEYASSGICKDMLPLTFQAISIHHHSAVAVQSALDGKFGPPKEYQLPDYAAVQARVDLAIEQLSQISPDAVNDVYGKDVLFELGEYKMNFNAEDFLLSMSAPNFYFHTTTAYDILRMKGVAIGKRDFLGALPIKAA